MDSLFLVASILLFIGILRNLLQSAWLLHKSEYRVALLFPSLQVSRSKLLSYGMFAIKLIGLLAYIPVALHDQYLGLYHYFVTGVLLLNTLLFFQEFIQKNKLFAQLSAKELLLIIPTIIIIWILYVNPLTDMFFWLLLLEGIIPIIFFFFAIGFSFPFEVIEDIQIERARKIREIYKSVAYIGITGEYSSKTAELITQLLGMKWEVIKISGVSQLIQIARIITSQISHTTKAVIVEMKTHRKGDIAAFDEFMEPEIGVVTNGMEDIQAKNTIKYEKKQLELLETIRSGGIGIWNVEGHTSRHIKGVMHQLAQRKIAVIPYLVKHKLVKKDESLPLISATDITIARTNISFTLIENKKTYAVKAPLIGEENIPALLPALIITRRFGFTMSEIIRLTASLHPLDGHMTPYKTKTETIVFDNTAASTVASLYSALHYMQLFSGKKILVLSSLFDLHGVNRKNAAMIMREIIKHCDYCLFLERDSYALAEKMRKHEKSTCTVQFEKIKPITDFLLHSMEMEIDIAVLMGAETAILIESVLKK